MITCKSFKSIPSGAFIGFATLFVEKWGVNIQGCKMFQKNGLRWVKFPDQAYEKDGEKKYSPYLWFEDKKHAEVFGDAAVKAIDEYCASQAPSVNETSTGTAQASFEPEEPLPF